MENQRDLWIVHVSMFNLYMSMDYLWISFPMRVYDVGFLAVLLLDGAVNCSSFFRLAAGDRFRCYSHFDLVNYL